MKILVTGFNGFVGKAVVKALDDHTVVGTSRIDSGGSDQFFQKFISSEENFSDCLDGVDVVIHTAARVHQMHDVSSDPLAEFMETNCLGTLNLARQCAKAGVRRFIFLSSIKVNGERCATDKPFRFDDTRKGRDPYGISKAEAELGLLQIAGDSELEVTIIRPPLVYGAGVKANFAALLNLASKNLPFPFGSVNNKRSFVALGNLVDLIVTCVNHPKAANQIFLVSDDNDVSIGELYTTMVEVLGRKARLVKVNPILLKSIARLLGKGPVIDRLCDDLILDIEHTKVTLDWAPVVSLADGVKLCVLNSVSNEPQ